MQVAAMILGILGGLWGLYMGISAVSISSWFGEFGGAVTAIGVVTIILSLCAIIGGGVAMSNAKAGGVLILIAGLGWLIFVFIAPDWTTILPALLLIVGGALGLAASRQTY